MKNLSEEIIQFFKENEYIDSIKKVKEVNPERWADNLSEEMRELFHKLIEFRNRLKD